MGFPAIKFEVREEEPPPPGANPGRPERLSRIAAAVRARPGVWFAVFESRRGNSAHVTALRLRYHAPDLEVVTRKVKNDDGEAVVRIYARAITREARK